MKTTLLIMAAGLGSRYGGNKQIDHIGPNGETWRTSRVRSIFLLNSLKSTDMCIPPFRYSVTSVPTASPVTTR